MKRVALTGGIACGKSLAARFLREEGFETLDADDIVHELVPEEERRRLAQVVFGDAAARAALEARLHPLVRSRLAERPEAIAVVPLLFEVHWEGDYDIICCVASKRENQLLRMTTTRGYTREEAEARLAAQLPTAEKAAKSHYVLENDASPAELRAAVADFARWLRARA